MKDYSSKFLVKRTDEILPIFRLTDIAFPILADINS